MSIEARTPPLRGPHFGSYAADEVTWLLKDLSHVALEDELTQRERRIQSGAAHYAESLPIEYQPGAQYQELFHAALRACADRLAQATAVVGELVIAERDHTPTLVSLARAGTPIGILMKRWISFAHHVDVPHYTISIVRDRGIDTVALDHITARHRPESVVFVDGWTGKGAIARELSEALELYAQEGRPRLNDELAVLADPGSCTRIFGTRDDFLIPSACLNSTVSGLVSRTVLNADHIGPGEFHGAKFYDHLRAFDVSNLFLDTVSQRFDAVGDRVRTELDALDSGEREPRWSGWRSMEGLRAEYGVSSVNFVKPGVGETTRVLLRRVPWMILVREPDLPEHRHIRVLAAERGVPIEVRSDLAYSCVGLIKEDS